MPPFPDCDGDQKTDVSAVWALRIWKLHTLEAVKVTGHDHEEASHQSDTVAEATRQESRLSLSFIVRACFSVTKV